jgi:hypothetical protein
MMIGLVFILMLGLFFLGTIVGLIVLVKAVSRKAPSPPPNQPPPAQKPPANRSNDQYLK